MPAGLNVADTNQIQDSGSPALGAGGDADPDRDALQAIRAGREDAFSLLVSRHQDRVYALCMRILNRREDAADAAQETFVKAWRAVGSFHGDCRFSTWLTRIAINQCRNELRKRKTVKHTQPESLSQPVGDSDTPRASLVADPHQSSSVERMVSDEVKRAYTRVLEQLEPEAREVLILKEVESLSYEGMAEILEVPIGTVRSRLHRARHAVRVGMQSLVGPLWLGS